MEHDGLTCEYSQNRESPSPAFNTIPSKSDSRRELAGQGQKYSEMDETYVAAILPGKGKVAHQDVNCRTDLLE